MDIQKSLIKLAKSVRYQNLFSMTKEMNGIKLFQNDIDFSRLQEHFLCYLFTFDGLHRDIVIEKISKKVLEDEIFWESYLLWKKQSDKKVEKNNKQNDVHLIPGKKIKFDKRN
jgi:hypothetical protein